MRLRRESTYLVTAGKRLELSRELVLDFAWPVRVVVVYRDSGAVKNQVASGFVLHPRAAYREACEEDVERS